MNNEIIRLNELKDTLTSQYLQNQEEIKNEMILRGGAIYDNNNGVKIDALGDNERVFKINMERINSMLEKAYNSMESDPKLTEEKESSEFIGDELPTNESNSNFIVQNTPLPEIIPKKIVEEFTDEYISSFSLDNHIGYVKDLSVKASFVAGSYVINSALTSVGLPPVTGLKYIAIGGIKVAGIITGAAINYGVQNPGTTVAVAYNLPVAYIYAEKVIKKLNTKKEASVEQPINVDKTLVSDTTVVPNPVVDKSVVESHSIWDFFEVIGSITWKVLKKIESLF